MATSDSESDMLQQLIYSAFLKAAFDGNLTLLKRLVSEIGNGGSSSKAYEEVTDGEGRTALHLAAAAGKTPICKFLVEKLKLDIDLRDDQGNTPLLFAILEQRHATAVYLIESGAGIGWSNSRGYTALHYAAEKGQKEMLRLLLSKGAKAKVLMGVNSIAGTPLHCACYHGKKEAVKILLDNNAEANFVSSTKRGLTMHFNKGNNSGCNNMNIFADLIIVQPNAASRLYFTPLMLSIFAGSYECMELLFKAGADPNIGGCGKTPLIVAACEGEAWIVKYLLKVGADPNVADTSGVTPLEHAALRGMVAVVMALFPYTSRISSFPDWSVRGIMNHILSEESKAQREVRRKNDFELSKSKGQEAFQRKEYEEAIFWFTQASLADKTDAAVISNRSLCWAKLNVGDRALEDAETCVALKPDWPKAHYREGVAWMLLKHYSMASEAFSQALKLDPNNKEIKKAHRDAVEAEFGIQVSENLRVLHF